MSDRPNILFLMSDQHRADCTSLAGHPSIETPHLDRLAREGWSTSAAYCQNPVCTPSRMCFLTGTYASTHGYFGLYGREPTTDWTSLIAWCRAQGYRTGVLGKLHTPRYWLERHADFVYDEFLEYPSYLEGLGLHQHNDSRFGFYERERFGPSAIPLEHSCEMALARRFLDNQMEPKDRRDDALPWAAWVSFSRPHQPWTPSEPFAARNPPEAIELDEPGPVYGPAMQARQAAYAEDPEQLRRAMAAYHGVVEQVDRGIGEILALLEERGLLDDTIIVYSSDHSEYAGRHGLMEKKGGIAWDCTTRIPFIIRHPPSVGRDVQSDCLVESIDLFPTLCELAGLAVPDVCQGRSLRPVLDGRAQQIREDCLTENPLSKALCTGRYRYVTGAGGGNDLLFDLHEDPREHRNLAGDPDFASLEKSLCRRLLDRVAAARRPVTILNPHPTGNIWHGHRFDCNGLLCSPAFESHLRQPHSDDPSVGSGF